MRCCAHVVLQEAQISLAAAQAPCDTFVPWLCWFCTFVSRRNASQANAWRTHRSMNGKLRLGAY